MISRFVTDFGKCYIITIYCLEKLRLCYEVTVTNVTFGLARELRSSPLVLFQICFNPPHQGVHVRNIVTSA